MVEYLPLGRDLERLRQAHDLKSVADLDRSIQVKQTIENLGDWTCARTERAGESRGERSFRGVASNRNSSWEVGIIRRIEVGTSAAVGQRSREV